MCWIVSVSPPHPCSHLPLLCSWELTSRPYLPQEDPSPQLLARLANTQRSYPLGRPFPHHSFL